MRENKLTILLVSILAVLLFGTVIFAAPQNSGNIFRNVTPEADETYYLGTTTKKWLKVWTEDLAITGSATITNDLIVSGNATTTGSTNTGTRCFGNSCIDAWSSAGSNVFNQWLDTTSSPQFANITIDTSAIISSLTAGSIIYTDASKTLTDNNSDLFYDITNSRVGIGNNSPQTKLDVTGTTTLEILDVTSNRIKNVANPVDSGDAINKAYFDANASGGLSWQEAVINILDFTTSEPAGPTLGDRYITNATGTMSVTGQYGYNQYIYTWASSDWATTTPTNQMALKNTTDGMFYTFNSDDWNWNSLGSAFSHNATLGIQGGASNEYYHLTFNQSQNIFIKGVDDSDDIDEGSSNLFYTNARVDTRVQGQDYTVTGDWVFSQPLTVADPTTDLHAVNKQTMDLFLNGLAWQEPVDDKDLSTPPGSPTLGDRYIVAGSASGWYDTSWSNRQQLDLANADVDAAMTDYPVLIKLTSAANSVFATAQSNGNDILFTDEDGNKLKHELESFNATDELLAWVKIPYLSSTSTTNIYMYYGNAVSGNQQEVADTWDSNYEMVYHFDETSGSADDSTGVYDGSNSNITYSTTGKVGKAYDYNGSNAVTDTNYSTSLSASDFTIEGWLKADSTTEVYAIAQAHTSPGYSSDFIFYYNGSTNLWWMRTVQVAQPGGFTGTDWNYIVMAWDQSAGTYEGFVNGVSAGTSGTVTGYGGVNSIKIGSRGDGVSSFYEGVIDEVKISASIRSDDYISTTYNIQSDPANFVTFGAEEAITASGDWAGHINSIMEWDAVNWNHATPTVGWATIVLDESVQYTFDGTDWVISSGAVSAHNDTTGKQGGKVGEYFHWESADYTEVTDWLDDVVLSNGGAMDIGTGNFDTTGDITATNIEASEIVRGNLVVADGTGSHPSVATGYVELYVLPGAPTGRILPYTGSAYIDLAIGDWNGGDPNIMLKTGGKVGINEGSPETKLHVNGDGYFKGAADTEQLTVRGYANQVDDIFVVEKSDGTDLFTVDNNGNATTTLNHYFSGYASSTTGLYTQSDGHIGGNLTVDGNATTTGLSATTIEVNDDYITDFTGTNLSVTAGVLSAASGGGSSAWEQIWTNAITPTTTNAGIFVNASSTIAANFRVDGDATTTGKSVMGFNSRIGDNSTYMTVEEWDFDGLGIGSVPLIRFASPTFFAGSVYGAIGDALVIQEVDGGINPGILFVDASVNSVNISFATTTNKMQFTNADEYTFDDEVNITGNATTSGSFDAAEYCISGANCITDFAGTNLSITNGVLNAASGGSSSQAWEYDVDWDAMKTTSTKGIYVNASSTIATLSVTDFLRATSSLDFWFIATTTWSGDLLVDGNASTTGNLDIDGGELFIGGAHIFWDTSAGQFLHFDEQAEFDSYIQTDTYIWADDYISIGTGAADTDDYLYFDFSNEYLMWDDSGETDIGVIGEDQFELSDDLAVTGNVTSTATIDAAEFCFSGANCFSSISGSLYSTSTANAATSTSQSTYVTLREITIPAGTFSDGDVLDYTAGFYSSNVINTTRGVRILFNGDDISSISAANAGDVSSIISGNLIFTGTSAIGGNSTIAQSTDNQNNISFSSTTIDFTNEDKLIQIQGKIGESTSAMVLQNFSFTQIK